MRRARVAGLGAAIIVVALSLSGCGLTIPSDPDGSLERIEGATLHAGMAVDPGLAEVEEGEPTGPLVTLVEAFAAEQDADVEWTIGSEESLVDDLEGGDLDVAVGGMTSETPWLDRAGMTRGYPGIPGADGREIVMFVPLGENRLLSELERFLDREVGG